MKTDHEGEVATRATYAWIRREMPQEETIVVLHLADAASTLVFGAHAQPTLASMSPLGIQVLSDRFFPGGRLDELSIELAIAEVEDRVMPWHTKLPKASRLFAQNARITELAHWAGMPDQALPWLLKTEAVEELFNRWTALAQGRPASQDPLPTNGQFSAALLMLRECLHHWGFHGITVLPLISVDSSRHQPIQ